jgi:hypothetical protein
MVGLQKAYNLTKSIKVDFRILDRNAGMVPLKIDAKPGTAVAERNRGKKWIDITKLLDQPNMSIVHVKYHNYLSQYRFLFVPKVI